MLGVTRPHSQEDTSGCETFSCRANSVCDKPDNCRYFEIVVAELLRIFAALRVGFFIAIILSLPLISAHGAVARQWLSPPLSNKYLATFKLQSKVISRSKSARQIRFTVSR